VAEVLFHLELSDEQNVDGKAEAIQQRLSELDSVNDVEAVREEPRLTGLEVVAAIAVGIQIAKGGNELVAQLRKLIPEIRRLIGDIKGVKNIVVEVGGKRVPVGELNDQHLEEIGKAQLDA